MEKKDLKSMDLNEVTAFVTELGEKPFRAKQLYQWMHQKLAPSLELSLIHISRGLRRMRIL